MSDFEEKNEISGTEHSGNEESGEQSFAPPIQNDSPENLAFKDEAGAAEHETAVPPPAAPEENGAGLNEQWQPPVQQPSYPNQPEYSPSPNQFTQGAYGYTPNPAGSIEFSNIEPGKAEKISNSGFRTFIIILCVILVVAIATGGGYIFGISSGSKTGIKSNFTSYDLADRPTGAVEEGTASYVYRQVVDSVVLIDIYSTDDPSSGSQASGVVYSADGYIVTNDHIYANIPNPKFLVTFSDGTQLDGTYVAGDSRSDLAVIKVDAKNLKVATFGNSEQALVGEDVVAIGNPSGSEMSFSLTDGTISAVNRWAANNSNYSMKFIQIDAAINPGNSGGALCNMYGQVIGITAWKYVGEYYENVAFAIPTTTVKRVCDDLISSGYVVGRAKLGIKYQMVDAVNAKINNYGHTGLLIAEITNGTPIASTSAQVGDLITQINGKDIKSSSVVLQTLEDSNPGDTVTLTIISGKSGASYSVDVTLLEDKGTSSYTTEKSTASGSASSSSGGGEFNFPDGE